MKLNLTISLFALATLSAAAPAVQLPVGLDLDKDPNDMKVNVSLYVMSKCPDARLCENIFGQVLRTESILPKISLSLHYIGALNSSLPLGVDVKHGPTEAYGNAHQLCLYHHLPLTEFWAAVECMNFPSSFPKDIGKVGFTKQCAETVGVDWWGSGVGKCVEGKRGKGKGKKDKKDYRVGKEGRKLLVENIRETEETGITTSCTIEIDSTLVSEGKRTCVVDGGVWKGCDDGHTAADFVRVIDAEWENLKKDTSFNDEAFEDDYTED
ncbi:hypothetical protein I314_05132 [Cryptococcus bacillisporus CA1873]|uniref:Uncharacterized protein n=1 Tax=Cryptococcus bacillisporus CA1873 TaxID=1296111 RepID=A0ABR5B6H8_CRYGA|nr:hypothetical protein I314_05132 [Cryptococcus bacillisporus CA1873]|eukprot:KIR59148.1 hypothetical protein I314_05132 [Cryptococcus gattii CA1873]